MHSIKVISMGVSLSAILLFSGCAEHSLKVLPDVKSIQNDLTPIAAKIEYTGNKEYLPLVLMDNNQSDITATYSYEVKYVNGSTAWDGLNLFNPLLIVGFPLSEEAIIVEAKLSLVMRENHINKLFTSSCIATKTRSLYQNSGSSSPRKSCLLAVRDNINNQIIQFKLGEKQ